jgi:uncharacterized protein (DUF111 family)
MFVKYTEDDLDMNLSLLAHLFAHREAVNKTLDDLNKDIDKTKSRINYYTQKGLLIQVSHEEGRYECLMDMVNLIRANHIDKVREKANGGGGNE